MAKEIKDVEVIMRILKKKAKNFENPIVTEIGEKTKSPYMVLVSCLLSLRTMDKITGPISKKLFEIADTPEKIAKMPLKKLQEIIMPVNYYITKSKRIKDISKILIEEYDGKVPDDFDELMKLKGVGRKTASIVMVYGHRKPYYIPVDSHVHIIANRIGWVKTKTAEQTMDELMKKVPKKYWRDLNDVFVMYGQNVCTSLSPFCSRCVIRKYCPRIGVTKSR